MKLGLVTYPTKMAVEIRPPIPVDKGRSVGALAGGFDAAMFAGDDFGDISAFDALDELRTTGRLRRAVRVAAQSTEVPPALLARADLVVDGPTGVVDFLTALADAVSPTR